MFPQYGDGRYPPGFGSGQGQIPMDPTAGGGRYGYPGAYASKGPEGSQFGGMSGLPRGAQHYGGKPGAMASQEAMYGHSWGPTVPGQPYMSLSSKQVMGAAYPAQVSLWLNRGNLCSVWVSTESGYSLQNISFLKLGGQLWVQMKHFAQVLK